MASLEAHCSSCNDDNETYICRGCSTIFSFTHLSQHREEINQRSYQIDDNYNSFRQILNDQKNNLNQHSLMEKINRWEQDSTEKIQQTADQCRQKLTKYMNKYVKETENKLNDIFDQPIKTRKGNLFNEIDLDRLELKLNTLKKVFDHQSNISIEETRSPSFINRIYVTLPFDKDTPWKQKGVTIAGGNGVGTQLNQLQKPLGICMDDGQTVYVVDRLNDRIMEWKSNATNGRIVAGGNGKGNQLNQLNQPADVIFNGKNNSLIISDYGNKRVIEWSLGNTRNNGQVIISNVQCWGLTIDKNGDIYISDIAKHEVRRWKKGEGEGTLVAGGNGRGNQLNQLSSPTYIFVDNDLSLYVSDSRNDRVMKWAKDAKEGIVIAGGNGTGNSLRQLSYPCALLIDQLGQIYVADWRNHRVMRWCEGDEEGSVVVGGNEEGNERDQLNYPVGLSFDYEGNLYVADCLNHRIQKFAIDTKDQKRYFHIPLYSGRAGRIPTSMRRGRGSMWRIRGRMRRVLTGTRRERRNIRRF